MNSNFHGVTITGSDFLCIFKEPLNTKMQRKKKFTIKVMGKIMKLMMLADLHCVVHFWLHFIYKVEEN